MEEPSRERVERSSFVALGTIGGTAVLALASPLGDMLQESLDYGAEHRIATENLAVLEQAQDVSDQPEAQEALESQIASQSAVIEELEANAPVVHGFGAEVTILLTCGALSYTGMRIVRGVWATASGLSKMRKETRQTHTRGTGHPTQGMVN